MDDVATKESWPKLKNLPKKRTTLPLSIDLNAKQAARIKQGFIPAVMEEKWFSYYSPEEDILYLHRSWTGNCIAHVYFENLENGGSHAFKMDINRYKPQYDSPGNDDDVAMITELVLELAKMPQGAHSQTVDSMVKAFSKALQPNYMGSPKVVKSVLRPYLKTKLAVWNSRHVDSDIVATPADEEKEFFKLVNILTGEDENYTYLEGWHTPKQLGAACIKYFDLDEDYCAGESMEFIIVEAISAISLKIGEILREYQRDRCYNWLEEVVPTIAALENFIVAVLMGTNTVLMPGKTIADFGLGKEG